LILIEGTALTALGHHSEAASVLRAALEADPTNVDARLSLAYSLINLGEPEQAATVLEDLRDVGEDPRILMVRGQIRHALGDKGCLEDFSMALERDPQMYGARIELIDAAFDFGKKALARQHLTVLTQDARLHHDPEVVRLAGLLGERDLALERAELILASAELERPSLRQAASAALVYKSAILLELGKITTAVEAARSAVKINDAYPDARLALSAALKAAGSLGEALDALGRRDDPRLTAERVQLLLDIDHCDEAVRLVRSVVRAEPRDEELATRLLDALVRHGLLLQTARMLVPQLVASPSPSILRSAGRLLSQMGDFQRAVRILELARRLDSSLGDVDAELAWAYRNLEPVQPRAVLAAANRGLRRAPGDLYLLRTKADALLQMDRAPQARRLLERIREGLSSEPPSFDSGWLAGWCSYRMGDYERALDHLLRSISTSPRPEPASRFDLGLVLLVSRRPSRARREYSRAIDEARTVASPLRRHGILQVAMVDLDDALVRQADDLEVSVATQLQSVLLRELKATRSSFVPVHAFLSKVDDLLPSPNRRAASRYTQPPASTTSPSNRLNVPESLDASTADGS
jgi:tetratricopeptide (TPR) repeat protein